MKKTSIKKHLTRYSIYQKRKTTINHAFASALAPTDTYNEQLVDEAIQFLGQDANSELYCVYCGNKAYTWDHLVGLVKDGELRGFGHQIGNLVPCCRDCNSAKGSLDWGQFLETTILDPVRRSQLRKMLVLYNMQFAKPVNLTQVRELLPDEWARYGELKHRILDLMKEADVLANQLRESMVRSSENSSAESQLMEVSLEANQATAS